MSDIAIRVENLSKRYKIQVRKYRHDTLRDHIVEGVKSIFRSNQNPNLDRGTVWALKDVSFEVKAGDVIGIIGPNGAGKSTLLKIITRITEPSSGRAYIYGRLGSLLEVGTGFDRELTGRENIYLSGAILGMRKVEIDRKFDEIIAFSGIETFIDTPVKRYSSGMYVRLAFSVAAHLDPEILIVDEVLAVGDAKFQEKCLNKMEEVGQEGRSILMVSHNMTAVKHLCKRTILFDRGQIIMDGSSHQVVAEYLNSGNSGTAERKWLSVEEAPCGDAARLRAVRVRTENGMVTNSFDIRQPVVVEMEYEVFKEGRVFLPLFRFINKDNIPLFESLDQDPTWRQRPRPKGCYMSSVTIPGNFLAEGRLLVSCHLLTLYPNIVQFSKRKIIAFEVTDCGEGDSARGDWMDEMEGVVRPLWNWKTRYNPNGSQY